MPLTKTLAAAAVAVRVSSGVSAAPLLSIAPADVNVPLQPAGFALATIAFRGQALGTSAVSLTPLDFAYALGNSFTPDVMGGSVLVPIPATAALLLPCGPLRARRARRAGVPTGLGVP